MSDICTRTLGEPDSGVCFDLADEVALCRTSVAIQDVCARLTALFGYQRYRYSGYLPAIGHVAVISDYPPEWCRRYDERGYLSVDPLVRHCWTHTTPLRWSDVRYSLGRVSVAERRVVREAREFGLCHGISMPVHGAGAEGGALSLASSVPVAAQSRRGDRALRLFAQALHESVKTIALHGSPALPAVRELTEREAECLRWTANGKTSWEIAKILKISESTVIFHLRNAIAKLEVTNRPQAVAKAIEHSRILPF